MASRCIAFSFSSAFISVLSRSDLLWLTRRALLVPLGPRELEDNAFPCCGSSPSLQADDPFSFWNLFAVRMTLVDFCPAPCYFFLGYQTKGLPTGPPQTEPPFEVANWLTAMFA